MSVDDPPLRSLEGDLKYWREDLIIDAEVGGEPPPTEEQILEMFLYSEIIDFLVNWEDEIRAAYEDSDDDRELDALANRWVERRHPKEVTDA